VSRVRQVVVGAAPGDAITAMAHEIHQSLGAWSAGIYSLFRDPAVAATVEQLHDLPPGSAKDVLVYHASFGEPRVTGALLRRPEQLVVVYHNMTPSTYYLHIDATFAAGLEWGRHELGVLAQRAVCSIAMSEFNARDLRQLGYDPVHVMPIGLRTDRLTTILPSTETSHEVKRRTCDPYVLVVSQLLPHKRHEHVLEAVHLLQSIHRRGVGLVVAGSRRSTVYADALERRARALRVRDVWFTGRVDDRELATLYRCAAVHVSASEHEGLGVPALEAMSFGVPVVVRDAGALRDTVGDAALVLPTSSGPSMFAEAIARVLDDPLVRAQLVTRGRDRARRIDAERTTATRFVPLLETLLS
jgi:glycosyltransferase involved in cell wall biosynthesis